MKRHQMLHRQQTSHLQRGFNLMEVLIGIAVFAIGMLALASFQGALTRSAADAKLRTVAANIAESEVERLRGFEAVIANGANTVVEYNEIVDGSRVITRDGVNYTLATNVTDWYYNLATDAYSDSIVPTGALASDYKTLQITVTWDDDREFVIQEGTQTSNQLGSGGINLSATISSIPSGAGGKVSGETSGGSAAPPISYTPGARPDVVSLNLGGNKFKESLTPQPDVIRADELVETRFDVITYSSTGPGTATFLRREEFSSVSCDCTLRAPDGDNPGKRPTYWAGDEYFEAHLVTKAYGESANNQQSRLCDSCCRDHHDGGSAAEDHSDTAMNMLDPFRPAANYHTMGTFNNDHKHYSRANDGTLSLAGSAGDVYVESCRMVRVDGFWRVAQDFRQEDRYTFPVDFLDDPAEVATYSAYVTGAADAYENATVPDYETNPPCIGGPTPCVAQPTMGGDYPTPLVAGELPSWTQLPMGTAPDEELTQQLRSRGIYIDYLSYDMRTVIDCLRADGDADSCTSGEVELDRTGSINILELIPFFEVQLTFLNRWNESPVPNTPVDTTNQALADDNTHSRGVASRDTTGVSIVEAKGHEGNEGFTDTAPIDMDFTSDLRTGSIVMQSLVAGSGGGPPPPPPGDPVVVGNLTETINGLRATDIEIEGLGGALCDRTPSGYECTVPAAAAATAQIKILGYGHSSQIRYACPVGTSSLTVVSTNNVTGPNANVVYALTGDPAPDGSGFNFNVQDTACGA